MFFNKKPKGEEVFSENKDYCAGAGIYNAGELGVCRVQVAAFRC